MTTFESEINNSSKFTSTTLFYQFMLLLCTFTKLHETLTLGCVGRPNETA